MTDVQRRRKRILLEPYPTSLNYIVTRSFHSNLQNSRIGRDPTIVLIIGPTIGCEITRVTHSISAQRQKHSTAHLRRTIRKPSFLLLACSPCNKADRNETPGPFWSYQFGNRKICRTTEGDTAYCCNPSYTSYAAMQTSELRDITGY